MRSLAILITCAALLAGTESAYAQSRGAIYVGAAEYDLSGVDQATLSAIRVVFPLRRYLAVEASIGHAALRQDIGKTNLYLPEVVLQGQLPLGRFVPYLGLGIGVGIDVPELQAIDTDYEVMFSAGGGVRVDLPYRMFVGADARLRTFGTEFTASGSEAALGIGVRF